MRFRSARAQDLAALEKNAAQIDEGLAKQSEDVVKLQQKLADAKAREAQMVARHQTATNRLKIRSTLYDERVNDAFTRFEQVERALDELEGRVDVYDLAKPKSVADEIAELEASHQVESDLAELKAKLAQKAERA